MEDKRTYVFGSSFQRSHINDTRALRTEGEQIERRTRFKRRPIPGGHVHPWRCSQHDDDAWFGRELVLPLVLRLCGRRSISHLIVKIKELALYFEARTLLAQSGSLAAGNRLVDLPHV